MRSILIFGGALAIAIRTHSAAAVVLDTEGLPDSGLNTIWQVDWQWIRTFSS